MPSTVVTGQSVDLPWRVGVALHAGADLYRSDFRSMPGYPLPPGVAPFTNGSGFGYDIAMRAGYRLFPGLRGEFQVDMQVLNGILRAREGPTPVAGLGTEQEVTFEHAIDASFTSLGAGLAVRADIDGPLSLRAGLRAGYLLSASFTQTEEIVDPPGLTYTSGGRLRTIVADEPLPGTPSLELSAGFSLGYEVPLGRYLLLQPEVTLRLGLTEMAAGTNWRMHSLRAGIAGMWQPVRSKGIIADTVYRRDTTVQVLAGLEREDVQLLGEQVQTEQEEHPDFIHRTVLIHQEYVRRVARPAPVLTADMNVRFVLGNGTETEGARITIEKLLEKKYMPLLPYIFFDSMSSDIPARYHRLRRENAGQFTFFVPDGYDDMLPVYYDMLNIVGQRMKSKPGAVLTITGTNADEGGEKKNTALSRARAEAVRDYLTSVWDVDDWRLTVRAVNLPDRPSNPSLSGGSEENRRVELSSDDADILAPVYRQDTIRIANPPIVRFYPQVVSEAGIASWNIRILQHERVLKMFREEGDVPNYVDWNIGSDRVVLVSADAPMQYVLTVRDFTEQTVQTARGTITFQVRDQISTEEGGHLRQYALLAFDYDGAGISPLHRHAVAAIRSTLPPTADVSITGMTDILGDEDYNRQLSARRAEAIASILRHPRAVAVGIGEQTSIPATTPEGRFYSRRVDIIVRTHEAQ